MKITITEGPLGFRHVCVDTCCRGGSSCPAVPSELRLHVRSVYGRRHTMPPVGVQPIDVIDVDKVLLSIAPRDEAGEPIASDDTPVTWTSSDENVITLEAVDGDAYSIWARTPHVGTAIVTAKRGDLEEQIQITVKAGAAASLNLSAGAPVPE